MDLSISGDNQCPADWGYYPINIEKATGGLLGTNPVICGGLHGDPFGLGMKKCYMITPKETTLIAQMSTGTQMSTDRVGAASVTIDNTLLWITGGQNSFGQYLSSSEYIQISGHSSGPELPLALFG